MRNHNAHVVNYGYLKLSSNVLEHAIYWFLVTQIIDLTVNRAEKNLAKKEFISGAIQCGLDEGKTLEDNVRLTN